MLCAGLGVVATAVRERGPGALEDPDTLVTWGLHARSRNPMYLGVSVAQLGLAGASRNAWMLASSAVSAALLHRSILQEEPWLDRRFGPDYDTYRAEVPRWW
jgi:protein-S-isoprenylcysteine O-methyltransferase Ste14